MRLAIVAKALKRRAAMLSDEHIYRIISVVGFERAQEITDRQERFLIREFAKLLDKKSFSDTTDDEIVGVWELVILHLSPIAYG